MTGDRAARDELSAAYQGLEAAFADRASEAAYRAAMLERSAEQAEFLTAWLDRASVLEIGCGNGRLLVELARRGAIGEGVGIDPARSRIEFARRWAADERLETLRFEAADALELEPSAGVYDAIVCITGTFGYFEPLGSGTAAALLRRWTTGLRPGGLLVLELYPHPEIVRLLEAGGETLRLWRELGPEDPWRFYLSEFRLEDRLLVHSKTFIHRTTGEVDVGRRESLELYSEARLGELLSGAGLIEICCRDGWTDTPYDGAETMVVTARAPG
jgi:SAM-dependent methyltransferase